VKTTTEPHSRERLLAALAVPCVLEPRRGAPATPRALAPLAGRRFGERYSERLLQEKTHRGGGRGRQRGRQRGRGDGPAGGVFTRRRAAACRRCSYLQRLAGARRAMQGRRAPSRRGVRQRERAWERKKERQRDSEKERQRERESGVAGLERDLSDGLPDDDAEPTPIFVCSAARTHVVHFPAGAALGDLRAAVKRMGYSAGENGLCVVGGAPLPLDDRLTLAQCGIRANSSVQVAGRLRGGVEVTIRGRQHTVNARGHLDLRNQNLGPAEVKQIAAFLATSAGAAVSSLCCANNPGMVGELYDSGRLKTPDVQAEVFKQLTDSLKISKVTEVDFSSCGIGPVALGHLSDWVRDATGALNSIYSQTRSGSRAL
jgi:hypothetical protein